MQFATGYLAGAMDSDLKRDAAETEARLARHTAAEWEAYGRQAMVNIAQLQATVQRLEAELAATQRRELLRDAEAAGWHALCQGLMKEATAHFDKTGHALANSGDGKLLSGDRDAAFESGFVNRARQIGLETPEQARKELDQM